MVRRLIRSEGFAKHASTDIFRLCDHSTCPKTSSLGDRHLRNASAPLPKSLPHGARRGAAHGGFSVKTHGHAPRSSSLMAAYCPFEPHPSRAANLIPCPLLTPTHVPPVSPTLASPRLALPDIWWFLFSLFFSFLSSSPSSPLLSLLVAPCLCWRHSRIHVRQERRR